MLYIRYYVLYISLIYFIFKKWNIWMGKKECYTVLISCFIFHISFCPAVGKMKYVMGCPGSTLVVFKVFLTIPWNCKCTSRWKMEQPTQGRTGRRRLAAHNERRHPAKAGPLVRFSAPLGHWSLRDPATPPPTNKLSNAIVTVWLFAGADGDTLYTTDEYEYKVSTVSWCQDGTCKR